MIERNLAENQRIRERVLSSTGGAKRRITFAPSMMKMESDSVKEDDVKFVDQYYSSCSSSLPSSISLKGGERDVLKRSSRSSSAKGKSAAQIGDNNFASSSQQYKEHSSDTPSSSKRPSSPPVLNKSSSANSSSRPSSSSRKKNDVSCYSDSRMGSASSNRPPVAFGRNPRKYYSLHSPKSFHEDAKTAARVSTANSKLMNGPFVEKYQDQMSHLIRSKDLHTTKMYRNVLDLVQQKNSSTISSSIVPSSDSDSDNLLGKAIRSLVCSPEPKSHGKARAEYELWYAKGWLLQGQDLERVKWLKERASFGDADWFGQIERQIVRQRNSHNNQEDKARSKSFSETQSSPPDKPSTANTNKSSNRNDQDNRSRKKKTRPHPTKRRSPPQTVERLFQFHPNLEVTLDASCGQFNFTESNTNNINFTQQKSRSQSESLINLENSDSHVCSKPKVSCWWTPSEYKDIKRKISENATDVKTERLVEDNRQTPHQWKPIAMYHAPSKSESSFKSNKTDSIRSSNPNLMRPRRSSWFPSKESRKIQFTDISQATRTERSHSPFAQTLPITPHFQSSEQRYRPYL
jgi:hypothetical protein